MTTEELLPCPFCGDEGAESQGYRADGSPWPYIECLGCGASAEPDMWNRRTPPTDALVEALKSVKWDCENCDWHCINCGHNQGMTETDLYNAVCRALDGQTPQSGKKEDGWKCAARAQGTGDNDPAECDWPMCGCDPYADKVIASLQESGSLAVPENKNGD